MIASSDCMPPKIRTMVIRAFGRVPLLVLRFRCMCAAAGPAAGSRRATTRLIDRALVKLLCACEAPPTRNALTSQCTTSSSQYTCTPQVKKVFAHLLPRHEAPIHRHYLIVLRSEPPLISPEYSVLLLGLDNAGKTTLLEQIKAAYTPSHPNLKTVPTVGQNTATLALPPPNPPIYLKLWDVGGQHSLRGLWTSYYSAAHAIVFVLDSSDVGNATLSELGEGGVNVEEMGRLDEARLVLESILGNEETSGVPILVLANKQDREDCVEVVRIKEGFVRRVFEGEKGGNVRDSRVLPCSALTGTGVNEAVEWLVTRMMGNKEARPPVMR
jgi:ADP-ribosylation factor related protein 1